MTQFSQHAISSIETHAKCQTRFFVLSVHMHNQSSSGAHYFDLELACTYVARFCFSFLFACVAIFANLKVYLLKC